jgi:hypothetical protein
MWPGGRLIAQLQPYRLAGGVEAGPSFYRFDSISGTGIDVGLVLSSAPSRHLILEAGLSIFDAEEDFTFGGVSGSSRLRFLLPEVNAEWQAGRGKVRPYVALGGGAAVRLNGAVPGGTTLRAGIGTRWMVGARTVLRAEVRARTIRPFDDRTIDVTIGIEWVKW